MGVVLGWAQLKKRTSEREDTSVKACRLKYRK